MAIHGHTEPCIILPQALPQCLTRWSGSSACSFRSWRGSLCWWRCAVGSGRCIAATSARLAGSGCSCPPVAFYVTFAAVRGITHAIRAGVGPFHDVAEGGVHIHHLVWGILLLLGVGYLWLLQIGAGDAGESRPLSRLTAVLYGIGAALTLDEFALWLDLRDVYWAREGRESVDAVLLFGALLSAALLGGPFFRALARALARLGGRP